MPSRSNIVSFKNELIFAEERIRLLASLITSALGGASPNTFSWMAGAGLAANDAMN